MVGLHSAYKSAYPHQLSGGQARRVGVARALALNPKVIIADEPTAGLDVSVQGEILNLMKGLQSKLGLSYLVITHNLPVVRHLSNRLAIMYLGRFVEIRRYRLDFRQTRASLHPGSARGGAGAGSRPQERQARAGRRNAVASKTPVGL